MEEKNLTNEDLNEDQLITLNKVVTDQYFKYKLSGVVVHNGTSESGHYYSFIKDRENTIQTSTSKPQSAAAASTTDGMQDSNERWFEFNDTRVNYFNPQDMPNETYGGENENWETEMRQYANDPAMQHILHTQGRCKTKNAYILIYERE